MTDDAQEMMTVDEALALVSRFGNPSLHTVVLAAEVERLRESLAACQKSNRELLQSTEESLKRLGFLEEREPLVQALVRVIDDEYGMDLDDPLPHVTAAKRLRDFDLGAKVENADHLHPTGRHPEGGCGCTDGADSLPCVFHSPNEAQALLEHLRDSLRTCCMQLSTARELRDAAEAKSDELRGRWDRAETAREVAEAELKRIRAQPADPKLVNVEVEREAESMFRGQVTNLLPPEKWNAFRWDDLTENEKRGWRHNAAARLAGKLLPASDAKAAQPAEPKPDAANCPEVCCTQRTNCAQCGKYKHTPLRRDELGGYVCLTCIDDAMDLAIDASEENEKQAARLIERASAAELKLIQEPFRSAAANAETLLAQPAEPKPVGAQVCGRRCEHDSECLRPPHDDAYHRTQHGCGFYDDSAVTEYDKMAAQKAWLTAKAEQRTTAFIDELRASRDAAEAEARRLRAESADWKRQAQERFLSNRETETVLLTTRADRDRLAQQLRMALDAGEAAELRIVELRKELRDVAGELMTVPTKEEAQRLREVEDAHLRLKALLATMANNWKARITSDTWPYAAAELEAALRGK